jgi:prepilin-type N-terminal cleavage/methylation domain-containing protein
MRMPARGFTLLEVMAAGAILAIGLAASLSAYGTGMVLFEHQRHTTHGLHLAEGKLEELLLRPSSDLELQVGTTFGPEWFDANGFATAGAGCVEATSGAPPVDEDCRYRVTWQVTAGLVPRIRVVTVTTAWNERDQERTMSLSTQRN